MLFTNPFLFSQKTKGELKLSSITCMQAVRGSMQENSTGIREPERRQGRSSSHAVNGKKEEKAKGPFLPLLLAQPSGRGGNERACLPSCPTPPSF